MYLDQQQQQQRQQLNKPPATRKKSSERRDHDTRPFIDYHQAATDKKTDMERQWAGCRGSHWANKGPLLGNFEENILNGRLEPVSTVDGYRAKLKAIGSFETKQLEARLEVSFFSAGPHSFPYLCQAPLDKRGYRIPRRGTLQVALLNPLGTVVRLFLLHYDLTDMPASSQTFLRQRTVLLPSNRVQYLIQFNIVSSGSGRIYLYKDLRIFISKKINLETASRLLMSSSGSTDNSMVEESYDQMPTNPKYFAR